MSLLHQLFTHLYQCGLMDIYFVLRIILQLYFILMVKLLQFLPLSALSATSFVPLTYPRHCGFFLRTSSPSAKMLQVHLLYTPCPGLRIRHSSREPQFHLLENNARNQELNTKCAGCHCSQLRESGSKGIHVYSFG